MPFPEELAPSLAKWLAPYVAAELAGGAAPPVTTLKPDYDAETCAAYVRELGQGVLNRAGDFFRRLERDGRVGSLELAQILNTNTPRNIPANLTNSLKQRARRLGLEVPWAETVSLDDRTVWVDRDGIAARMVVALAAEDRRRFGPTT